MSQESFAHAPEFPPPDSQALAPHHIVPMLIGSTVEAIERELVLQTLARCDGNRTTRRACSAFRCARCGESVSTPPTGLTFPRVVVAVPARSVSVGDGFMRSMTPIPREFFAG
jgi:hypothetical protein